MKRECPLNKPPMYNFALLCGIINQTTYFLISIGGVYDFRRFQSFTVPAHTYERLGALDMCADTIWNKTANIYNYWLFYAVVLVWDTTLILLFLLLFLLLLSLRSLFIHLFGISLVTFFIKL